MNEVRLSGRVKRTWTYGGALYIRLAVRRQRRRPQREARAGGNADYVTVVFPRGCERPPGLAPGLRLRVQGWLQSRDVDEALVDFLARAQPGGLISLDPALAARMVVGRSVVEVVVERWEVEAR